MINRALVGGNERARNVSNILAGDNSSLLVSAGCQIFRTGRIGETAGQQVGLFTRNIIGGAPQTFRTG